MTPQESPAVDAVQVAPSPSRRVMVQAREEHLLSDLSPQEMEVLAAAIDKVEARARQLTPHG